MQYLATGVPAHGAPGGEHEMDDTQAGHGGRLLTPGEVATLFRVDPKTVTRWAAAGRISSIRTPGGHRRFRESEVRALLEGGGTTATTSAQIQTQAGNERSGATR